MIARGAGDQVAVTGLGAGCGLTCAGHGRLGALQGRACRGHIGLRGGVLQLRQLGLTNRQPDLSLGLRQIQIAGLKTGQNLPGGYGIAFFDEHFAHAACALEDQ